LPFCAPDVGLVVGPLTAGSGHRRGGVRDRVDVTPSPEAGYREGREEARRAAADARGKADRLSWIRAAVFLGILLCAAVADPLDGTGEPLAVVAGVVLAVVFVGLVRRHRRLRREEKRSELRARLHELDLARLARDWERLEEAGLPDGPAEPPPGGHPFAHDLHLFGRVSLFRLAGPVTSAPGRETLARWLLNPHEVEPAELEARQRAVTTLAGSEDARSELAIRGLEGERESPAAVELVLGWAEAPGWLRERTGLWAVAWAGPAATLALGALDFAAGWPALWIVPLVVQIVALRRVQDAIKEDVDRVSVGAPAVERYADQLEVVSGMPDGPRLSALRDAVAGTSGESATDALRSLRRRLDWAESRPNIFYQTGNYLLLLDVHVFRALEGWKARHGGEVRGWLDALGEAEALSALGTMAHDHPSWAVPEITSSVSLPEAAVGASGRHDEAAADDPEIVGEAVGHPLLAPELCVRNDVRVGPPGTLLLVTGSNMSGKSTLLRAIGADVVLALAGGPVCADSFRLPVVTLWTSMMVGDSLAGGVSRFMAELLRLQGVVDAARSRKPDDPVVLYLLDEILQGTNTAERRIAARTVLRHLLDEGAIGAVTTHDLTLHQAEDLERRSRAFHFRERVSREDGRPRLDFDYRLRPGLSTTTNALDLLEAVGLGPEEEGRG